MNHLNYNFTFMNIKLFTFLFAVILSNMLSGQELEINKSSSSNFGIYFNYKITKLAAKTSKFSSAFSTSDRDFSKPYEIGEIFYQTRKDYTVDHKFTSKFNFNLGLTNAYALNSRLNIYYGLGLEYFEFGYSNTKDTIIVPTAKLTVVSVGESPKFKYESLGSESVFTNFAQTGEAISAKLIYLQIPLGLEINLSKKISMRVGTVLSAPAWSRMKLRPSSSPFIITSFPPILNEEPIESKSTIYYNSILYNGELSMYYHHNEKISVNAFFSKGLNSVSRDLSGTDYNLTFGNASSINQTSFGIGVVYR